VATQPNGAVDIIGADLAVPDRDLDRYAERYERYLGRRARVDGALRVFDLRHACFRLVPAAALDRVLLGEPAPPLRAFVGYAVGVQDPLATRRLLERNGVRLLDGDAGAIVVPADAALGASVTFRITEGTST
jgi:hypothetical protein